MLLNIKKYCLFLAMLPVMSLAACSSSDSGGCKTDQECSPPTPYCDLVSGDCVACLAYCSGRECGPDPDCGTSCGKCTGGEICQEGLCICKPQASSGCHQGDVWWFDSCGNPESLITDCAQGCSGSQCTDCTPDCGSRECGPDPVCGASCGVCTGGKTCRDGSCDCASRASVGCHNGDIWWLDSCGAPEELITECTYDCKDGQCQECMPDCGDRECGPDPVCGTNCGDCTGGKVCTADGLCQPEDMPCPEEGCPPGMYCDLGINRCVAGCMEDSQCSSNELCDVQTHECVCKSEYHRCSGACVSDFSVLHCGTSCSPCPIDPNGHGTATCNGVSCDIACDVGFHLCSGACVSDSSTASCGSRCSPCPTDPHGVATCDGVNCGISCNTGYHLCSGDCVSNDSTTSCGSRCNPCPTDPNGVATCDGTSCGISCNAGYHLCSGDCVSNNSTASCGSRCDPCPTDPNGVAICDGTSCGTSCSAGYHLCSNGCSSDSSTTSCGSRCDPCSTDPNGVATCDGTSCGISCNAGYHLCSGQCADDNSVESCGERCTPCPSDPNGVALCVSERCEIRCNPGFRLCGTACCAWAIEVVDSSDDVGRQASLALDVSDDPHISYHDYSQNRLKYAYRSGGGAWQRVDVDYDGTGTSLDLDDNGSPHVAYHRSNELCYARWTGTSWDTEQVDICITQNGTVCSPGVGEYPSLTLDGNDYPHIVHFDHYNYRLKYAGWNGTSWSKYVIDYDDSAQFGVGWYPSIALDSAGVVHVSYKRDCGAYCGDLLYWNSKDRRRTYIYNSNSAFTSIKITSAGNVLIAFYDGNEDALKLAFGAWGSIETVDFGPGVGWYASLAVDAADNPHIAYYDHDKGDLKYARWDGTSWSLSVVDHDGNVGRYCSLALDGDGNPHIAYYDKTNGDLKYAR